MRVTIQDFLGISKSKPEVSEWIFSKLLSELEEEEKDIICSIDKAVSAYKTAGNAYEKAIVKCTHPLTFRTYHNTGSSGSYYDKGSYWTDHICHVCSKRWTTSQSWEIIGDGKGLPNSSEEDD